MSKKIRLDKFLAGLGYGSRKEVGKGLRRGFLLVNGEKIADNTMQIIPEDFIKQDVSYEGEPLEPISPLVVILNKPLGYVCSHEDDGGESIFHLLPNLFYMRTPELQMAGRLDKDTTGLVILTDDGDLLHRIISPKTSTPKTYEVTLEKPLSGNEANAFISGELMLRSEKKPLLPAELIPDKENNNQAKLILKEGRYHQVRRMFASQDNKVTKLHRSRIGNITLDNIPAGEYRIISKSELECQIFTP